MSYRRFGTSDPDVAVQPVSKMVAHQRLVLNDASRLHRVARRAELLESRLVQSRNVAVIIHVAVAGAVRFDGSELHDVLTGWRAVAPTRALISEQRWIASQIDSERLWFGGVTAESDCRERTFNGLSEFVTGNAERCQSSGAISVKVIVTLEDLGIVAIDEDAQNSIGNIAAPQAWQSHGADTLAEVFAGC